MKNTVYCFQTILVGWIAARSVTLAFITPCAQHNKFSIHSSSTTSAPTSLWALWDPRNLEKGSEFVEFPTPSQRAEIKKEAKKRRVSRQLPYFSLPDAETDGPWSDETIQAIWKELTETEMMELKGISRQEIRGVYQTAKWFCEELEELISPAIGDHDGDREDEENQGMHLPVALISTKGHTALIYCPTLPVDHPDKFVLRTSVGQKNVWRARPKPLRDISGQIIKESNPDQTSWS
mmetsp:Transcript_7309/g.17828  ORF Transcript_7309/g.17828 Transcript_7309/m.17828 type:complete len:236 (-) Transcript_7309:393-1100(-)